MLFISNSDQLTARFIYFSEPNKHVVIRVVYLYKFIYMLLNIYVYSRAYKNDLIASLYIRNFICYSFLVNAVITYINFNGK